MSHDTNLKDPHLNVECWRGAWRNLGCAADDSEFRDLVSRYGEPHRRYHTTQHLSECLGLWRTVRALASRPGEVAIALWFHDAVYDTKRQDNEERSADLARDAVTRAGLPSEVGDRVHALIMATAMTQCRRTATCSCWWISTCRFWAPMLPASMRTSVRFASGRASSRRSTSTRRASRRRGSICSDR